MRAEPWWDARITGAFMSYWIYQHLGNLSPPELAEEEMLPLVQADEDAGPRLREAARRVGPGVGRTAAGRTTATSATRGCSCSTRAPPACSPTDAAR